MKKLTTLLIITLAILSFTACGNYTNTADSHETTDSHDATDSHDTAGTSGNTGTTSDDSNTTGSTNVTGTVDLNCTEVDSGTVTFRALLKNACSLEQKITSKSTNGDVVNETHTRSDGTHTYTGTIDSVTETPVLTIYANGVKVTDGTCK